MNLPFIRNFRGVVKCLSGKIVEMKTQEIKLYRQTHVMCNQFPHNINTQNTSKNSGSLLLALLPVFNQTCGMKQKGVLQLRCKGCYKVARKGRMYVMCSLKPRHKQMQMQKSFRYRRILTFAHQKKIREW